MKNRIKEYRQNRNLTQVQLAKLAGVSSRSIIAIEKGEQAPSLLLSYKISKVLDVPMEELFLLEENLQIAESEQCLGCM